MGDIAENIIIIIVVVLALRIDNQTKEEEERKEKQKEKTKEAEAQGTTSKETQLQGLFARGKSAIADHARPPTIVGINH